MDIIDTLLHQHENHRRMFESDLWRKHFSRLREELLKHVALEERILFTELLELGLLKVEIQEAWEEHRILLDFLKELDSLPSEKQWNQVYNRLKRWHLSHIEQEENDLFPKIRKEISDDRLRELVKKSFPLESKNPDEILYPKKPGSHEAPPRMD